MTTHELKVWPPFFDAVFTGAKPFEVRRHDRPFEVGDWLRLREWDPMTATYSGRQLDRRVTCVLVAGGCPAGAIEAGYVVLGLDVGQGTR